MLLWIPGWYGYGTAHCLTLQLAKLCNALEQYNDTFHTECFGFPSENTELRIQWHLQRYNIENMKL